MSSKPIRLFLIRHGETEWNTAQIFQGHLDSPLTATGVNQATSLAERLASEEITVIYSSDQGRSMHTAEIVAERHGLSVHPHKELREIDCGQWTGLSYEAVRGRWPKEFAIWRSRPDQHQMPGGESVAHVQERCVRFVEEIRRSHIGHSICVVTHNTPVRTLLCHFQGLPLSELHGGTRQPNCAVNLIEFRNGRIDLIEVASTQHLTTISTLGFSV